VTGNMSTPNPSEQLTVRDWHFFYSWDKETWAQGNINYVDDMEIVPQPDGTEHFLSHRKR